MAPSEGAHGQLHHALPLLLEGTDDETARPLSERSIADLAWTNVMNARSEDSTRAQRSRALQPADVHDEENEDVPQGIIERNEDHHDRRCGNALSQPGERAGLCRVKASDHHEDPGGMQLDHGDIERELNVIDFADDDGDGEIMVAEEEVEIWVVNDSGAVKHMANPKHLPSTVEVVRPASGKTRRFVSANNQPIEDYGEAKVDLELEDGTEVSNVFQVADVSRPLHSTSTICDAAHEMLYTKHEAVVVPEGALSKFLESMSINVVARYQRRGGLYMAKMKAKDPRLRRKSGFARPGPRR
jgi:hypothetical protein